MYDIKTPERFSEQAQILQNVKLKRLESTFFTINIDWSRHADLNKRNSFMSDICNLQKYLRSCLPCAGWHRNPGNPRSQRGTGTAHMFNTNCTSLWRQHVFNSTTQLWFFGVFFKGRKRSQGPKRTGELREVMDHRWTLLKKKKKNLITFVTIDFCLLWVLSG